MASALRPTSEGSRIRRATPLSMAALATASATAGTFPTHGPLFVTLLVLTVLILGALTFFPVLALGPIAEETARLARQSF